MKNCLRRLSLGLVIMMMFSISLSGCGSKKNLENVATATQTTTVASDQTVETVKLEEAKLRMYLLGDKPVATDEVYAEVNKKLKNDINATLEVTFLGWADWDKKYDLLFASGEDFDLIYTSNWALYAQEAAKGAFLEITQDMLKKYSPRTLENTPEQAWKQTEVNGKTFMLPNTLKDFQTRCLGIRGDLREKYGLGEIKTVDDYINYLDVVAKNEKGIIPLDLGSSSGDCFSPMNIFFDQQNEYVMQEVTYGIGRKIGDAKFVNMLETPEFADFVKKMKEFKDKGYWSKNALNSKTQNTASWTNGKAASAIWGADPISVATQTMNSKNPTWKAELVDGSFGKKTVAAPLTSNGMGINANSKNPERSLMLLDLFKNDPTYYYLTWFGIEGKHYNLSDQQGYVALTKEGSEKYAYDSGCQWGWKNGKLHLLNEGGAPNFLEIRKSFLDRDAADPLVGMSIKTDAIKTETAALQNVSDTYLKPLVMGFIDPVAGLEETKKKFKQAGIDKVLAEWQKQADAYIK